MKHKTGSLRRTTFGQYLVLLLAVDSTICFLTGISGYSSITGTSYYHGWERLGPFLVAVFCYTWFYGLRQRHIWAWYTCGVFFVCVIIQLFMQGLLEFIESPTTPSGWWTLVSQGLKSLIIFYAFWKWWLPKKGEFRPFRKSKHHSKASE